MASIRMATEDSNENAIVVFGTAMPSSVSETFKLAARNTLAEERAVIEKYLEQFKNEVVTPETKVASKGIVADIRKKKKDFVDMLSTSKKAWMSPYDEIKGEADEITKMFDEPICLINQQIKECEELEKEQKRSKCKEAFDKILDGSIASEYISFESAMKPQWLNVSTTMASVKRDITGMKEKIEQELGLLEVDAGKFFDKAIEEYKKSGNDYLSARRKIQELKEFEDYMKKQEEEILKQVEEAKKQEEARRLEESRRQAEEQKVAEEPSVNTEPDWNPFAESESEMAVNPFISDDAKDNPFVSGTNDHHDNVDAMVYGLNAFAENPFTETEEDFVAIKVKKSDLGRIKELLEATGFEYKLV